MNSSYILQNNKIDSLKNSSNNIKDKEDKELMEVCQEFESIFLYMVMKEMKKTIPEDGLIERSPARDIFEDMYMEEMSKETSKSDEVMGLAKMMYEQLKQDKRVIID